MRTATSGVAGLGVRRGGVRAAGAGDTDGHAGGHAVTSGDPDSGGVSAVVGAELEVITGAIARLRVTEWWRLSDDEIVRSATAVEEALRSGFGVQMRLAGEIAERGTHAAFGERSAAHLIAHALRIPVGQAQGRIAASRATTGFDTITGETIPAALPALADAIDTGSLSDEHARVITTCAAAIPPAVDEKTRALCHSVLLDEALVRDPIGLRRVAEQIRLLCDPDGKLSGKDATDRMQLTFGLRRTDGLTSVRGLLDDLTTEHLRVALQDLAAPRPIDDHTPDPRPAPVRAAQAFGEVLARYLATREALPDGPAHAGGGARPVVAITIPAGDLAVPGQPAGDNPSAADAGGHDHANHRGSGRFDYGAGRSDYGGAVTTTTARMLACDGLLIRQVLGAQSAVLDQGRAVRLFTRAQRRALTTRDRGCAFPGCDIPAGWCEAHHITYWSADGTSDLENAVLLCRRHHTVIHQEKWRIQPSEKARGRPWFIPPPHVDRSQRPRRNRHFQLPDALDAVVMSTVDGRARAPS